MLSCLQLLPERRQYRSVSTACLSLRDPNMSLNVSVTTLFLKYHDLEKINRDSLLRFRPAAGI